MYREDKRGFEKKKENLISRFKDGTAKIQQILDKRFGYKLRSIQHTKELTKKSTDRPINNDRNRKTRILKLDITSVSTNNTLGNGDCVRFLKGQDVSLGLPVSVYEFAPRKPVVVITWQGTQPELPSILLNSHVDVVPVYPDCWTFPPFEAHVTDDGYIYARGVQDMKSVGMIHLEAVRRLRNRGQRLKRTVHVSFVPDKEIGSIQGMKAFSESEVFRSLNIGFELDESCPSQSENEYYVFYGERTTRQIRVTCRGNPTHGSHLESDTAGEKIHYIIDKFMKLRAKENKKFDNGMLLGDVTTINLTELSGGVQINVMPENLSVSFDIRIAPDRDCDEFEKMIDQWCKEAGTGVTYEYDVKNPLVKNTSTDDPFYLALKKAVYDKGANIKCVICPGATDARYVRRQGIPAISFTPLCNTPILLHCHDERLHVDEYMKGIDIMEKVLEAVANV